MGDVHPSTSGILVTNFAMEPISAASKVLGTRELVAAILDYVNGNHYRSKQGRELWSCLFVNSLWASEAIRYLWAHCSSTQGCWPYFHHLAFIDPERRQIYANSIKSMAYRWTAVENASRVSQLLSMIGRLSFPRLERLDVGSSSTSSGEMGVRYPPLSSIEPFLLPRLKRISIAGSGLTDEIFISIQKRCLRVERLEISLRNFSLSADAFALFIQNMQSLRVLLLRTGAIEAIMSSRGFKSIAQLRSLEKLELIEGTIQYAWTKDLQLAPASEQPFFPKLECFEATLDDDALESLTPFLSNVRKLRLEAVSGARRLFRSMTRGHWNRLESLKWNTGYLHKLYTIDLLSFVKGAPNLSYLDLAWCSCPETWDLIDKTVEDMARYLPNLQHLSLRVQNPGDFSLTGESMISLGRHCPLLRYCELIAIIDIVDWARNPPPVKWPNLRHFTWTRYGPEEDDNLSPIENDALARSVLTFMPKICSWFISFPKGLRQAIEALTQNNRLS